MGEPKVPLGVRSLRAAQLGDQSPKSASDEFEAVTLFSRSQRQSLNEVRWCEADNVLALPETHQRPRLIELTQGLEL